MRRTAWAIGCCVIGAATASLTPLAFAPRGGAAAAEGTRTTLITAGRAPRSPLRLALTKGSVSDVTMEMTQSIEQSLDGKSTNSVQTPPISFGTQTTVDAVAADGNAQITSSYHDIAVVDDGSFTAAQRAQLQSGLAPLTAMKVAATITTRNVYVASTVTGAEGLGATTAQLVEQVSDQSSNLAVPFPEEAVGVGARWRSSSATTLAGIDIRQSYEFTLLERDGNVVKVSMKTTQAAPRQRATLPGLPTGTKVTITKYRVSGSGTITMELGAPVAVEGESHVAGTQVFSVSAGGQSGTLTQKLSADVELSRNL